MFLTNPCSVKWDIFLADLLDEGHRERVPGDDAVVHQLHEGRQSEGQQVTKTTRQHTRTKNTHHSKLHSSRWLGPVFSCKAQMAWNITRNERSAETERERERWRGARERNSMLRPGLLEKDRSTETGREKGEMGQRFCDAVQTGWPSGDSGGPSEGQQEPGSTVRFSIRIRKSYIIEWSHAVTQISGEINHSARVTGGQSRKHIKQLLHYCWKYLMRNSGIILKWKVSTCT